MLVSWRTTGLCLTCHFSPSCWSAQSRLDFRPFWTTVTCCQRYNRHIVSPIALSQLCWRFTATCYSLPIAAKFLHVSVGLDCCLRHCRSRPAHAPSWASVRLSWCCTPVVPIISFRQVFQSCASFLVHLFCSVPCTRISFRSTHVILYMADLADVGELPFVCYADSQIYFHCLLSGVPSAVRKLEVSVFRPASWICSWKQLPMMLHTAQISRTLPKTWV